MAQPVPMAVGAQPLVALRGVDKSYLTPAGEWPALRQVDLEIGAGEFVAVTGKSGSGKSTLLHLVGGIDRPSAGEVRVAGQAVHSLSEDALARWRGRNVGVVFQFFQLLPTLTAVENVMLPMDFADVRPPRERRARALELLGLVGIPEQADKLPCALSGGQQQRVAIARALANDPPLVIADEPTGNLDSATAGEVLGLFRQLSRGGTTVVIATHERDLGGVIDRSVRLEDGRVVAR
jgi:putative ABC transport system ATP-binding protein